MTKGSILPDKGNIFAANKYLSPLNHSRINLLSSSPLYCSNSYKSKGVEVKSGNDCWSSDHSSHNLIDFLR